MTSSPVDVKHLQGSIWRIHVQLPEDLEVPQLERDWFPPLIAASATAPVCLYVVFSAQMRTIPAATTARWLDVLSKGAIKLSVAVMVSPSLAVRAAANAVSLAMKAMGQSLRVESFKTEAEADVWLSANVK